MAAAASTRKHVYLDHAASTPMHPEAVEAMQHYMAAEFATPSGAHRPARSARRVIDESRDIMAEAAWSR